MSTSDRANDTSSSLVISPSRSPTSEVQSISIRTTAIKLIDIINEQCAIATSRERAEKQRVLDALANLEREHINFRNNVALIHTELRKQATALQAERDHALAQRDQLLRAKGAASDGLRQMRERIEMYNGEVARQEASFRYQIPAETVAPEQKVESQGSPDQLKAPDAEMELALLRKRCKDLVNQNALLIMQVCTAEVQRAASEDSYKRKIAELEQQVTEL